MGGKGVTLRLVATSCQLRHIKIEHRNMDHTIMQVYIVNGIGSTNVKNYYAK